MSQLQHQRSADIESIYRKQKVLWLVFSSVLVFLFSFLFCFGVGFFFEVVSLIGHPFEGMFAFC